MKKLCISLTPALAALKRVVMWFLMSNTLLLNVTNLGTNNPLVLTCFKRLDVQNAE